MDSEKTDGNTSSGRSSIIDSIKGFTLAGVQIQKEDLRRRITMPEYLRHALRKAVKSKSISPGEEQLVSACVADDETTQPCESPLVVFINSKSGGRHGPKLKSRLEELMGVEQIFDLNSVKPHDFVEYGLGCLEKLATLGDLTAKVTREKLRIVVAGGDGTVGWVLGCLGVLDKQNREPVPPIAIIPLGTGNDLSRSFDWGGSIPINWKSVIKKTLDNACTGQLSRLDSWRLSFSMHAEKKPVDKPNSLQLVDEYSLEEGPGIDTDLPEKMTHYEGVFYNYFSIGMDAQVAYSFHHLRNTKPYLAQGPISNKVIYSGYSCKQGWFFTPCANTPNLSGLGHILKIFIKKLNCSTWELIEIPSSVRSIVALNLNNYASGRNPWGHLKPEYMKKRGFTEPRSDDGLLEIFGMKQGWHASFVLTELITAVHIAQAAAIRFVFGGELSRGYMQMDGEPWKQPFHEDYSTIVDIKRVEFQSVVVRGDMV